MTTLTDTQVITASGGLVELGYNSRTGGISVDGTSWGSATIINPNTTVVCDGSPVVVEFSAGQVEISSGSSVQFALFRDDLAIAYNLAWYTNNGYSSEYQPVSFFFRDTPTAGSHTYSVRAIKPPGTFVYLYANIGSSQFDGGPATMRVSKIVQATQWPAVTTGTIICTSSTRPAAPFVGQTIYETDTEREWRWFGSQWIPTSNNPARVSCQMTGTVTAPNTGGYYIPFAGADEFDTDSLHNPASNNTRIVLAYPGTWVLHGTVTFGASSAGNREAWFRKNGTTQFGYAGSAPNPSYYTTLATTTMVSSNGSDYVELAANHTSTSSLNLEFPTRFQARWVGK